MKIAVGTIVSFHDQQYRCVRTEPYYRPDRTRSDLAEWVSECADCGASFRFRTPVRVRSFVPNRRCDKHKRPGVPVGRPTARRQAVRPVSAKRRRGVARGRPAAPRSATTRQTLSAQVTSHGFTLLW